MNKFKWFILVLPDPLAVLDEDSRFAVDVGQVHGHHLRPDILLRPLMMIAVNGDALVLLADMS
jgi:hypothetical protein